MFVSLRIIYFIHVLLDCNLFEINISYGFLNIKTINSLCQQPLVQLIVTLTTLCILQLKMRAGKYTNFAILRVTAQLYVTLPKVKEEPKNTNINKNTKIKAIPNT